MTDKATPTQGEAPAPVSDSPESTNGKAASHRLTADAILAAKDLREEEVEVPEWGGNILIRSFSKKQQQDVRTMATVDEEIDGERLEMFMFIHGVTDPKFTDDQFEQLRNKNAGVMDRVLGRIMSISGMDKAAQVAAERQFPVTPGDNV